MANNVEFVKEEDKYKKYWGRKNDCVGSFDIKGWSDYGYLYMLNDFDEKYYAHIILKEREMLFRYETEATKISGMRPIVKINIERGIIYYLEDLYSDDDKNLVFEKRGVKLLFLSLSDSVYKAYVTDERYRLHRFFDDGGEIENSAKRLADSPNWTNDKLLKELNKNKFDLSELQAGFLKPSKIIGTGYKSSYIAKKLANTWLNDRIMEYTRALQLRGVMADGGNVEKKIKSRLAGNSFELPLQMAVYVPSTKDKNATISDSEMSERVKEVESYLAKKFGGFNSVEVDGGYQSTDKGVIQEDVVRVVAFASKEEFDAKFKELVGQIKKWCQEWSQESMGLEFENDMFYIDANSEFSKGGTVTTDDGDVLKFKVDEDEMSVEVDAVTKKYLTDIVLVLNRDFRKITDDKFLFWYDEMSDEDIEELESLLKTKLKVKKNKRSRFDTEYEDDRY